MNSPVTCFQAEVRKDGNCMPFLGDPLKFHQQLLHVLFADNQLHGIHPSLIEYLLINSLIIIVISAVKMCTNQKQMEFVKKYSSHPC